MTIKTDIHILAIESSCDDTAASVISNGKICSNVVSNQEIHQKYGGVVPELASRAHHQNIIPVVDEALNKAKLKKSDLTAIAFTQGPGLLGSLLVGSSFAKGMSLSLGIPLIAVNHLEAHVLAHFIEYPSIGYPYLCLLVSGGHTQLMLVKDYDKMEILGKTRDDAAGEAFDKSAKILGFPYPGGPHIDKLAQEGNSGAFNLPKIDMPGLDFSFSGLKTAIRNLVNHEKMKNPNQFKSKIPNLAATIQDSIVSSLIHKLEQAIEHTRVHKIALAGGVAANSGLRSAFAKTGEKYECDTYVPSFEYCTDNAAMIAISAYFKYLGKDFANQQVTPYARVMS